MCQVHARNRSQVIDRREILVERRKGFQQGQQGFPLSGLDDQLFAFPAHDGIPAGKLELAGNPYHLVSTAPEKPDVSFADYGALHRHVPKHVKVGSVCPPVRLTQVPS
jgi:hypothetical protein